MNLATIKTCGMATLRIALGAVFFYAGVVKLKEPQAFAGSVASFQILPQAAVRCFASSLPFFEAIAGFWLMLGWRRRTAAFAIVFLCGVFALALGQALVRGLNVDCGCFGSSQFSAGKMWTALVRDLLFMVAAGMICLHASRDLSVSEDDRI